MWLQMAVANMIVLVALQLALAVASCTAAARASEGQIQSVRISGRIIDATGEGVKYEAVQLRLVGVSGFLTAVPTDSDGRFILIVVQPKKYELVVQTPGYRQLTHSVDVSAGEDIDMGVLALQMASTCDAIPIPRSLALRLAFRQLFHRERRHRVSGRVVDSQGKGIANAEVLLMRPCDSFGAKTAYDGAFLVRQVWPDQYGLWVKGAGFLPVSQTVEVGKQKKNTDLGTVVVKM